MLYTKAFNELAQKAISLGSDQIPGYSPVGDILQQRGGKQWLHQPSLPLTPLSLRPTRRRPDPAQGNDRVWHGTPALHRQHYLSL